MKRFLLSAAWLILLVAFILVGVPYASYHGDETAYIYSSHDYATLFLKGDPQALLVEWPIDNELEYLRIADGSMARYIIGFAWNLAGYTEADLPTQSFNWDLDYSGARALGLIPDERFMVIVRLPSAILLALSAAVMFGLGYCFGGLPIAFFVSGLYTLNPIILLNGRRAMQEGPLLFFGLLTVLMGVLISIRRERGRRVPFPLWIGLIIAGALTLVSKNNGFIYIAAAFLWIFLPEMLRRGIRSFFTVGIRLAICGVLLIGLYIALSPGLWSDPLARIKDASAARISAMNGQMHDDLAEAPSSMARRVEDIFTQPFIKPLAHYDGSYTNLYDGQRDLIAAYDSSLISGIHSGVLLGVPLTVLAIFGFITNFLPRVRPYRSPALSVGLLTWLFINVGVLLWLPLPWQRYFLSIIPIFTIFAAVGLWSLVGLVRSTRARTLDPVAI
jgi:hypothetical protein